MVRLTASIPPGAHRRLTEHYGSTIRTWLRNIENDIAATAARFDITIEGFHDAGWASVVAIGHQLDGKQVVLKAFPDPERYHCERAALVHWIGCEVCRLLSSDEQTKVIVLELVGSTAGGSTRPSDEIERVANALPQLHRVEAAPGGAVPTLRDYYRSTVLPRIEHRASCFGEAVGWSSIHRALVLGAELCAMPSRQAMLHADLYAENVVFNGDQEPIFIDPHPKVGTPAFDWAFWCIYYRRDAQFPTRVSLCRAQVPDLVDDMLAWSMTLAVDGALYYLENNDPRASAMLRLLASSELKEGGR